METLIIMILVIVIIVISVTAKNKSKKLMKLAQNNLGKYTSLGEASSKLYADDSNNIFLLNYFVPIREHVAPEVSSEMRLGYGLISNPDYPNNPLFVQLVFKWSETIMNGDKYILRITNRSIYYLERM